MKYSISNAEEIFHRLYKKTHIEFHFRKSWAETLSLILSPKPKKNLLGAT